MYIRLKENFHFIETSPMEDWRREQGWTAYGELPYVIKAGESEEAHHMALHLCSNSEVVICGTAPEYFLEDRLGKQRPGITLRYSERIYKRGTWRFMSPRGWKRQWDTYYRYHNSRQYMLCASAYTSGDLRLVGSYRGKCYQWGYFPQCHTYTEEELMSKRATDKVVLLWCGRLIDWKHPEVAIEIASLLRRDGKNFELQMIGSGKEENQLRTLIAQQRLENYVKLLGAMTTEQVREHMRAAHIFLLTSDYQEGWGAVLNEAMNSGCAVVASHAAGAVPYLLQDGVNGLIYPNGKIESLYHKVNYLLEHEDVREQLGRKAYDTIQEEWNAKVAVERLFLLIEDLMKQGYSDRYQRGPCSKANIIKNNWIRKAKYEHT